MKAEKPALTPATPTSRASDTWLVASAASDTGTKRRKRRPASLRSLRRTGPGSSRQPTALILLGIAAMKVLVNGRPPACQRRGRQFWERRLRSLDGLADSSSGTATQYGTQVSASARS